jgi:integrase
MGPPKSTYGKRSVPLSNGIAQALWEQRKAASSDEAPVFAGERGMIDASTAFRALRSSATEAGVPWAGLHTLRHTCATILFNRGLNAKQVQVWLGHHSPAFTLATYVDLLSDDLPNADFLDEIAAVEHAQKPAKEEMPGNPDDLMPPASRPHPTAAPSHPNNRDVATAVAVE